MTTVAARAMTALATPMQQSQIHIYIYIYIDAHASNMHTEQVFLYDNKLNAN